MAFPEHISNNSFLVSGTFHRLETANHQCGELTADLSRRKQSRTDLVFNSDSAFRKSFDIGNCLNSSESIVFCIFLYVGYDMYVCMFLFTCLVAYVCVHVCGGPRLTS